MRCGICLIDVILILLAPFMTGFLSINGLFEVNLEGQGAPGAQMNFTALVSRVMIETVDCNLSILTGSYLTPSLASPKNFFVGVLG